MICEFERGKIMYPDFKKKAQMLLRYEVKSGGYWNSEKIISQVKDVSKVISGKYPKDYYIYCVLVYDHSSGHTENALEINRMNIHS